jgi:hypothetical protein
MRFLQPSTRIDHALDHLVEPFATAAPQHGKDFFRNLVFNFQRF